jgi:hypothetical protein
MTYNWHTTEEEFLQWAAPTLLAGTDEELFKQVSIATNSFENVTITMQINGIQVPVEHFEKQFWINVEQGVQKKAFDICKEVAQLDDLQKLLDLAKNAVERELYMHLTQGAGIDFSEDDE